jgi:hypothetical protein
MADDEDDDGGEGFEAFDPLLADRGIDNPWETATDDPDRRIFVPDLGFLSELLSIPVAAGDAKRQRTGRFAKAFDAWIAWELRRAGFPEGAVWPRARQPRVLPGDLAPVEEQLETALDVLRRYETALKAAGEGTYLKPTNFRHAVKKLDGMLPGSGTAKILGRFYVKQVDVVVSAWQRGPDVLISTKSMLSSYLKNKNNRYEEAVGEATNLRDRYPMAAMGFAFLTRSNIYDETGAFAFIRDLLVRLRKPDGPFDATMLLMGTWDDDDPEEQLEVEAPAEALSARRFFEDLIRAVTTNTPVTVHGDVRLRRDGEPIGGLPSDDEDDVGA